MKKASAFLLVIAAFNGLSVPARASDTDRIADPGFLDKAVPHLDLDMSGGEYAEHLAEQPDVMADPDAVALKVVLDLGKRNLELLKAVNDARDPSHQISLTSKETAQGIPIDTPRFYNVQLVLEAHQKLLPKIPAALLELLSGKHAPGPHLPVSDAEYIEAGRAIDRNYQSGMRWLFMKPNRQYYTQARKNDIRGYHFLSREPDLQAKLADWKGLDAAKKTQLGGWLVNLCGNTDALKECAREFARATQGKGQVKRFYDRYVRASKKLYDNFFKLRWPRSDVRWTSADPNALVVPFARPASDRIRAYLQDNIEDEFKWNGWQLKLDFRPYSFGMSHLRYEKGTTPHALISQSAIVMDEDLPITEYESQWVIRHEYGHIIGFPDCYVEFYDTESKAMVSYQIDITNLMCSRRGVFQQMHFDELRKHYFGK